MTIHPHILAKSGDNGGTPLYDHLLHVKTAAERIAAYLQVDRDTATYGALLHDIGKTSPIFQRRLKPDYRRSLTDKPFRHELASLFFLPLVDSSRWPDLIDMIVAHHKSTKGDGGILKLDDDCEDDQRGGKVFDMHAEGWEEWSKDALDILSALGMEVRPIPIAEAREVYYDAVEYCAKKRNGWSLWKGLLVSADHFASSLIYGTDKAIGRSFILPDLSHYSKPERVDALLYPLSDIPTDVDFQHTMVTAPTGAGKTDFLLRRCKGRVFYTLPFQASINAMYRRITRDLENTGADVRLLHASSKTVLRKGTLEEKALQTLAGASVKVLTPHQMASIAFGTKGYEASLIDFMGCDIILDEIHTYSDVSRAIVLKIIEVLKALNRRIHIGTATMPTLLYDKILNILGKEHVYEVKLQDRQLESFNRHIVHKAESLTDLEPVIEKAVADKQKVLIVCNQVKRAQELYRNLDENYPRVKKMLIHSRFKRGDRAILEEQLKEEYNACEDACIVVSTQVVEVSLDISFDIMITEAAPLDSLIQRFGRINRKRTRDTLYHYKPVYVLAPPLKEKDALPYSLEILQRSYEQLPDGQVLEEKELQYKIDQVYTHLDESSIEMTTIFKNGQFLIKELTHHSKAVLMEVLDIESAACITESDKALYLTANYDERTTFEIPVSFKAVAYRNLEQIETGTAPFIIPDKAYSTDLGILMDMLNPSSYDVSPQFL